MMAKHILPLERIFILIKVLLLDPIKIYTL
nr:MAG TPA: hypothetical protein [Caudoviricetes sp.]